MMRWFAGIVCFVRGHIAYLPPYDEELLPEYRGECRRCAWTCRMVMSAEQAAFWFEWFETVRRTDELGRALLKRVRHLESRP